LLQSVQRDGARRSHVQRINAVQHGNGHNAIGGVNGVSTQTVTFGAQNKRDTLRGARRKIAQANGVISQGEGCDMESRIGEKNACLGPFG
jgi:hypothetical protein